MKISNFNLQILAATADTAENLLAGFDLMETMLDAGTEDIECWGEREA